MDICAKDLMLKIAQQDYDYNSVKDALNSVKDKIKSKYITGFPLEIPSH